MKCELKTSIFVTQSYLTNKSVPTNLSKKQYLTLQLLEKQSILAHVKQDKGSEFVREWMFIILWKIEEIINKCNLQSPKKISIG